MNNPKKVSISDELPDLAIHLLDRFGNTTEATKLEKISLQFSNSSNENVEIEQQPEATLEDGAVILRGFFESNL